MPALVASTLFLSAFLATSCGEKKEEKKAPPPPREAPTEDLEARIAKDLTAIVATCASASGKVEVMRAGQSEWEPVAVGAAFREGDRIRTGPMSYARVQFQIGGALELDEKTAVTVDVAEASKGGVDEASGAVLAVESGSVRGVLHKGDTADSESAVPSGQLYVRTADGKSAALVSDEDEPVEFRLTHRDEGTEVAVEKGALKLVTGESEAGTIASGQAADLAKGGHMGKVTALLGFPASVSPGIDARFHYKEGLGIKIAWRAVKGAEDYRLQVARDTGFQSIVVSEETPSRSFVFEPDAEGMYAWRVAARDADGRLGEAGFVRRIYCEAEEPRDLLVAPADGAKFAFAGKKRPSIVFSWQSAGAARSYRLVIWRGDDQTGKQVVSKVTSSQSHTVDTLGDGRYSWGVYERGEDGRPLFVKPRSFAIKKSKAPKADTKGLWD